MAWDEATGEALGRGARFLRHLSALKPGERINLYMRDFQDMLLPINPLDRPTWEEKAEWLRSRAPFCCTKWERIEDGTWVFERPKAANR